ncbi:MAG: carboxymuconolactone decarboxylase family protein [Pseudomonadota bacterium]|jgi:alkylhydroperoxidase/carboxymuconolactone decarboxylase family protein YurZ
MKNPEQDEIREIYQVYQDYYGHIPDWVKMMGDKRPDALYHYYQLRKIGVEDGVLPRKVKELILIGINLVRRYETGLELHIKGALDAGATVEEICETIVTAMVAGAACAMISGPRILLEVLEKRKVGK